MACWCRQFMAQGKFKDWFTQHKHSFKNQSKKYATTLATYAWDKQINTQTEIKMEHHQKMLCIQAW